MHAGDGLAREEEFLRGQLDALQSEVAELRRRERELTDFIENSAGELLICCESLSRAGDSKAMVKRTGD